MNYNKATAGLFYILFLSAFASSCVLLQSRQANLEQVNTKTAAIQREAKKRAALKEKDAQKLIKLAQKQIRAIWKALNYDLDSVDDVVVADVIESVLEGMITENNQRRLIYRDPNFKADFIKGFRAECPQASKEIVQPLADTIMKLADILVRAHNTAVPVQNSKNPQTAVSQREARKRAALKEKDAQALIKLAQKKLKLIWEANKYDVVDDIAVDAVNSILEDAVQEKLQMPRIFRSPNFKSYCIEAQKNAYPLAPEELYESYAETMMKLQDLLVKAHNGEKK